MPVNESAFYDHAYKWTCLWMNMPVNECASYDHARKWMCL